MQAKLIFFLSMNTLHIISNFRKALLTLFFFNIRYFKSNFLHYSSNFLLILFHFSYISVSFSTSSFCSLYCVFQMLFIYLMTIDFYFLCYNYLNASLSDSVFFLSVLICFLYEFELKNYFSDVFVVDG